MVGMLITFNDMAQSPTTTVESDSINDSLSWILGLAVVGSLLMFLGLVHRQPIPESGEEASFPQGPPGSEPGR
jgi:hypothetical protein